MIRSWLLWRFGFERPFRFITSRKELHASTDRLGFEILLLRFLSDVGSLLLRLSFLVQEVKGIGSITLQCCWGSIELSDIRLVNQVLHVKCGSLGERGRGRLQR